MIVATRASVARCGWTQRNIYFAVRQNANDSHTLRPRFTSPFGEVFFGADVGDKAHFVPRAIRESPLRVCRGGFGRRVDFL